MTQSELTKRGLERAKALGVHIGRPSKRMLRNGWVPTTEAEKKRASKYKLLPIEVKALGDTCAICGGVGTDIDHDHATNVVRGVLCGQCNRGLGNFRDNPELLLAAAQYLGVKPGWHISPDDFSQRVRAGMEAARAAGKAIGRPPKQTSPVAA